MNTIKSFIAVSLAAVLAYFEPIHNLFLSLSLLFVINFVFGLLAGLCTEHERFDFRKAFYCIKEASVYYLVLACTFFIGDQLDQRSGAMQAVSTITYALLYFYAVNIARNLKTLFPKSKPIAFIHKILSIELLDRIPNVIQNLKQS